MKENHDPRTMKKSLRGLVDWLGMSETSGLARNYPAALHFLLVCIEYHLNIHGVDLL